MLCYSQKTVFLIPGSLCLAYCSSHLFLERKELLEAPLSKYGSKRRKDRFYADKYFEALPQLINTTNIPRYGTIQDEAARCYSVRTFDRFLDFFGGIEKEQRIGNEPKMNRKNR